MKSKTRFLYRVLFLVLFLQVGGVGYSQEAQEDAQLWAMTKWDKKLSKKWRARGSFQLRYFDNVSRLKWGIVSVGCRYKVIKKVYLGFDYRYSYSPIKLAVHRYTFRIGYKNKIFKRTTLSGVLKFQNEYSNKRSLLENVQWYDRYLRPKVALSHKIKKTDIYPFIAGELYYRLNYKGNMFDGTRLYLGAEYKFKKKQSVSVYYIRHWEYNVKFPVNRHIYSFAYNHSF